MNSSSRQSSDSYSSQSTTYSQDKSSSRPSKMSMGQRFKSFVSDIGYPPTTRYDRENGIKTKNYFGSPTNPQPYTVQNKWI